ncbi:MAG TPA: amylo-alpha-1,6-glucosidase, partial [Candidatus Wunengus sp. YC61]|uniref:amylo-alpha-1,6-glucosidase n=1 Tax=Candidatus Wunengus sp. YC61 TaxID=3367698 RepID=UPI0040267EEE
MEKEQNFYELIKGILSQYALQPYKKEEIKAVIVSAIRGYDYISAVIAYLWGAYNNFDTAAKVAFETIFFDDLKEQNQAVFYFFSFYFMNDFKRCGKDGLLPNSFSTDGKGDGYNSVDASLWYNAICFAGELAGLFG